MSKGLEQTLFQQGHTEVPKISKELEQPFFQQGHTEVPKDAQHNQPSERCKLKPK